MGNLKILINGAIIGIANIIPGVSGGTMALVLGIYERLINAINNISIATVFSFFGLLQFNKKKYNQFISEIKRIDGLFLSLICTGALVSIIALANLMTYFVTVWHDPTYGFFFGLVLLSVIAPYKLIKKKNMMNLLIAIIAIVFVLSISYLINDGDKLIEKAKIKHELSLNDEPKEFSYQIGISKYVHIFIMGAVAISAMILPGVSGSFLLLLMGGYFQIIKAISQKEILILAVFSLGCITGLIIFTKFLNILLSRAYDKTMSFLSGLVIGSLWIIWPFKNNVIIGGEKIYLTNSFPSIFTYNELYTLLAFFMAIIIVYILLIFEQNNK